MNESNNRIERDNLLIADALVQQKLVVDVIIDLLIDAKISSESEIYRRIEVKAKMLQDKMLKDREKEVREMKLRHEKKLDRIMNDFQSKGSA